MKGGSREATKEGSDSNKRGKYQRMYRRQLRRSLRDQNNASHRPIIPD